MVGLIEVLEYFGFVLNLNGKPVRRLGLLKYLTENMQPFVVTAGTGDDDRLPGSCCTCR